MAGSVNKVILVGRLGGDPEIKSFANGGKIAVFSLATSENWTDRASGERRERTDWHNIVINSEGLVTVAERYLKKGKLVYLEGQNRTRKWQDQSGADRWTTEVVLSGIGSVMQMLDSDPSGRRDHSGYADEQAERGAGRAQGNTSGAAGRSSFDDGFEDDEIPF